MDAKLKKDLETVVDSIISEDTEKATAAFHNYLKTKTQQILSEEKDEDESDDEDESEEKDESDDEDESDEDDESDKD